MADAQTLLYDPTKTFDDNFDHGPFPDQANATPFTDSGEPQYSFVGHKIYSPFGIGAGSLPTSKHVGYAFELGFDVVCYKTQRSVPFAANEFPNVTYLDVDGDLTLEKLKDPIVGRLKENKPPKELTITNSFGNPSRGPKYWAGDIKQAVAAQGKGQLLIVSVVGTIQEGFSQEDYYQDFANTAAIAAEAGAPVIEVNLSCPNVANEGIICYTYDAVMEICRRIKEKIGDTPLVAKIGYFAPEQQELLQKTVKDASQYVAAWSCINTLVAKVVDEAGNQLLPGAGRLQSGACGAGIKWAGLDMVKRLDTIRKQSSLDFEIIGIGGVMDPQDFADYRTAGANVVQSVTGAMWNPNLAAEIKQSLASS
jgi:dihydroorotate dehydrogenase (NAD+) catalytic subunit